MKIERYGSYHDMDMYEISNNKEKFYATAYMKPYLEEGTFKRDDLKMLRVFDNEKDFNHFMDAYKMGQIPSDNGYEIRCKAAKKYLDRCLVKEEAIRRKFEESSANFNALAEEKGLATDHGMSNSLEF